MGTRDGGLGASIGSVGLRDGPRHVMASWGCVHLPVRGLHLYYARMDSLYVEGDVLRGRGVVRIWPSIVRGTCLCVGGSSWFASA